MSILYAFYGDDFTGSTDVLEQLASHGVEAVLFLQMPTAAHLARFPGVRAIGVAGDSRSRTPEWMDAHLPAIFAGLRALGAPLVHYKVCSTFDSSPSRGSIGRAMEIGRSVLVPEFVPIVVGAPHLRRYVAFGNLFAAAPDGTVQRIDRHPMSRHPVTPMLEADLRVHLRAQTAAAIGLVDLVALQAGAEDALAMELARGVDAVLFDTVDEETLRAVGHLVWAATARGPVFSTSSSGLTAALLHAWRRAGLVAAASATAVVERASPLLVVSGSCSAATERQLRWALAHGYHGVVVDTAAFVASKSCRDAVLAAALGSLASGQSTVIYTALGPAVVAAGGDLLGAALGVMVRELAVLASLRRVMFCGGDTSSHAVQQLGLYALTWVANLQAGAPLCRAYAESSLNGLELVLKGGQVGTDDFFDVVRGV